MRERKKKVNKLLGEILLEREVITLKQLNQVLAIQAKEGGLIGEIIVEQGFAGEDDIAQCISFQYGYPFLPLASCEIDPAVLELIPKNVAWHYRLIPIDRIGDTITVAMANPLNIEAIEDVEDITSLEMQIFVSTTSSIKEAIRNYYK
jgi:type IV pilus assembly protein PilB